VCESGPATKCDPKLEKAWSKFDLETALSKALGKPTRVANDADVQGAAVIKGHGYEVVITLGTGFGTAFFISGRLLPHMEFAHVDFRKDSTFNEELGEPARKKIGDKKWNKRVREMIAYLDTLTIFDHLYIGAATHRGSIAGTWARSSSASPWSTTLPASWAASHCGRTSTSASGGTTEMTTPKTEPNCSPGTR